MLSDYYKIINDGIEVTNIFDFSIINQNIILSKEYVWKKYFSINNKSEYIYTYSFIYNDEYYILVLDEIILNDPLDDWEGHYWYISNFDMLYIDICKNKRVFRFDWKWFLIEENSDEFSENEMNKIKPIIRKNKIKKILNYYI